MSGEVILYQTEDGQRRVQCRFGDGTIWMTQVQIAKLFQTSLSNINIHIKAIYAEGEVVDAATIKSYLMVRTEGSRSVSKDVLHYSLEAKQLERAAGAAEKVKSSARSRKRGGK